MKAITRLISLIAIATATLLVGCTDELSDIDTYCLASDYISISNGKLDFGPNAETASCRIDISKPWHLSCTANWVHVSPAEGDAPASVTVTVDANKSYSERQAAIEVSDENGESLGSISITQAGAYEAVDLGLDVKWATRNVGAANEWDFGDYFSWGETAPKTKYYESDYRFFTNNSYTAPSAIAGSRYYDAATSNWGGSWRTPSYSEVYDLLNKCSWRMEVLHGVRGFRVTGKNGNSIFMPLAGTRINNYHGNQNSGFYWTCTKQTTSKNSNAYGLVIDNAERAQHGYTLFYGMTIRPVRP